MKINSPEVLTPLQKKKTRFLKLFSLNTSPKYYWSLLKKHLPVQSQQVKH